MRQKYYWLALIALAGAWIYSVGQSAGELLGLFRGPAQPAVTAEAPSEPLLAPLAGSGDEARVSTTMRAAERPPTPVPTPVTPPVTEPPPAVYADAEFVADGTESLDHPEVTDPHLRKLLRPAWDD